MFEPPEYVSVRRPRVAHKFHNEEREGNARLDRKWNIFARACKKLLWRTIHCANTIYLPDFQSGSLSCRGLWRQDIWIIQEYNLAITIKIRPLTQPHTCKMGSSLFASMSQLKLASMTKAFFKIMPSAERTKKENPPLLVAMLTMFVLILFVTLIQYHPQ